MLKSSTDLRRAAMDLLARREHSRFELEQKLHRRFLSPPFQARSAQFGSDELGSDCSDEPGNHAESLPERQEPPAEPLTETDLHAVLDRLEEDGLLSNERFTESYVRYRQSRGFGPLHIRQDLQSRRVPDALIEAFVDPRDEDWRPILREQAEKKLRSMSLSLQEIKKHSREHRRLLRFLQSRGFTMEQIQRVL